jgi:hypothetical protein
METSISIRRKMFHLTRVAAWAAAGFKAEGEVLIRPSQTGVVSTKVTPFPCDRLRGEERDVCNSRAEGAGEVRPQGHGGQLGWGWPGPHRQGNGLVARRRPWSIFGHRSFFADHQFCAKFHFIEARRQTPWILHAAQFWHAVRVD